jgi:hypothetical protein
MLRPSSRQNRHRRAQTTACASVYTIASVNNTALDLALRTITGKSCASTVFITAAGTFRLLREHSIASRVVITGASAPGVVTLLTLGRRYRHFTVSSSAGNLTVVAVTLANAYLSSGAAIVQGGSVLINSNAAGRFVGVTWRNNTVISTSPSFYARGGAVLAGSAASVAFIACAFTANAAYSPVGSQGGGLAITTANGNSNLTSTTFTGNTVRVIGLTGAVAQGGGLYVSSASGSRRLILSSCTFRSNQALMYGTASATQGYAHGAGAYITISRAVINRWVLYTEACADAARGSESRIIRS